MLKPPAIWKRLSLEDQKRVESWFQTLLTKYHMTLPNFLSLLRGQVRSKDIAKMRKALVKQMQEEVWIDRRKAVLRFRDEPVEFGVTYYPLSDAIVAYLLGYESRTSVIAARKRKG